MIQRLKHLRSRLMAGWSLPFSYGKYALAVILSVAIVRGAYATIDNTVTVNGSFGLTPVTDSATENVDVQDSAPALTVTKTSPTANVTAAGTVISYTITLDNTGNVSLTGISLTDTLDQNGTASNLTLTGPTGDADTDNEIDPTEVWTYTASYTVTQANMNDGNDLVNTVEATTTETGATVFSDNFTTTITTSPGLTVTKTAVLNDEVTANGFGENTETITYSFAVENTGNVTLTNVRVNDTHNGTGTAPSPANESLTTDTGTIGDTTDVTPNDGIWSVIAPGDTITFTATYTINQTDVDTLQ